MSLADLLFPKRCAGCKTLGSYLCPACFATISFSLSLICVVCNRASLDGLTHPKCRGKYVIDGVFASLSYTGIVKKLVYQFKYQPYLTDLEKILVDLMYEGLIQHEALMKSLSGDVVLVPIPLEKVKERKRGYNQAELLAKGIGQRAGVRVSDLLQRVKKTRSQFALNREERRENIKGAFVLKSSAKLQQNMIVLLVDDLVTSGATLLEASSILKRGGVKKVFGIALAHGQ